MGHNTDEVEIELPSTDAKITDDEDSTRDNDEL